MSRRQQLWVGMIAALSLSSGPANAMLVLRNQAVEVVGAGAVADPLIAVEANRAAIINRLAAEFGDAAVQAGVNPETLRAVLGALRADQLLAAALVGSFAELTAIVVQAPSDGALLQRYVALTPLVPQTLAALPFAQAYLIRDGDTLTVTRAQDLRLGETAVVGYFVSTPGTSVGGFTITPKDGPGTGANSWIGYTAGSNTASGNGSAVAAGTFNSATATSAMVVGGSNNTADGISSLVIGGFDNHATAIDAMVGAGAGSRATGARSVVVGGGYNLASGQWSFVGGGGRDGAGNTPAGTDPKDNIASGNFSVVTGGQANRATGALAVVSGGSGNLASGPFATVPGGVSNLASGIGSFAAGNRAKTQTAGGSPVIHNNTFAFADGSAFDFNTTASNEFAVRATGGVRFVTAIDGGGFATKTTSIDTAGHLYLSGNLYLPSTTAPNVGVINKSGNRFVHNFGSINTFVGEFAGNFSMTGGNNVGIGSEALSSNTTGFNNTASGTSALISNSSGSRNTAHGTGALGLNTTASDNTASGYHALGSNTTGTENTATGKEALLSNTTGFWNTATGAQALGNNSTGIGNTASGAYALAFNTTGTSNTASGSHALAHTTFGSDNTANGTVALQANTTGNYNTATGSAALASNTTGLNNTADGAFALFANNTGSMNTASGYLALSTNTIGDENTANGNNVLFNNSSGDRNTGSGGSVLFSNTIGGFNTASGYRALYANTAGNQNTAIGYNALSNIVGSTNIAIGAGAGGSRTSGNNNIDIGTSGPATESNTMRIGGINQSRTFIAGVRTVTTGIADAVNVVIDSAGQLGTVSSSRRFKDEIADMGEASTLLMQLRPVTFHYKAHGGGAARALQYGLIAEEVAEAAPGLVARTANGEVETVFYQFLTPMLLNEYQKQQRVIAAQTTRIAELDKASATQATEIVALKQQSVRIAELEQDRVVQATEIAELRRAVEVLLSRTASDGKLATAR